MTYPRTLIDVTYRPFDPPHTVSRLVDAINFSAAYEDVELENARDDVMEYWYTVQSNMDDQQSAIDAIDRITDILSNHGYILSIAEDYPGLWIIDKYDDSDSTDYIAKACETCGWELTEAHGGSRFCSDDCEQGST